MPNDNTAVCGCGVVLNLPKSRNGLTAISTRNITILIPKTNKSSGKVEGRPAAKKPAEMLEHHSSRSREPNSWADDCHGSMSSVAEQSTRQSGKSSKKDKRINSSRRTRSAERVESHYTYIDAALGLNSVQPLLYKSARAKPIKL
ncbi:hypothetical protein TSAR_006657 [Trichomalopsis sarcophagae]|uniref:Uncharacterized protein n=1 Tax=Trichomalopsis sarcophagae TaxID=543379 RepID=A0A232EVW3_9HYME|nr:hypothetical protein TSAR_006657 [Trichomalopsis sarcophagae]